MKEFIKGYYQRFYQRFLNYFIEWQKNGEIRPEIRPEFLLAALDNIQEMFGNANLRRLYPDHVGFTHELHNFFFYGIVTRNGRENK